MTYGLTIRPASWRDWFRLWRWRNDPSAYRYFIDARPVRVLEHLGWFADALECETRRIYIASVHGTRVGAIRLEGHLAHLEVSITVASRYRRHGYGAAMVRWAIRQPRHQAAIKAMVHENNTASLALFAKAGFCAVVRQPPWVIMWYRS